MASANGQTTKRKKKVPVSECAKALAKGNILQCLPLELRQEVFAFAAFDYVRSTSSLIEASGISERTHEWLPPMCHVNDDFFFESLPIFLKHIDFVIREASTAYGLYFFLQATRTFSCVHSLSYHAASTLTPFFAGPQLLKECNNLRHVWLKFGSDDFPSIHRHKKSNPPFKLDRRAFLENHSFRQLLSLKQIEKITICIVKKLTRLGATVEEERREDEQVWGVVGWLKKKYLRRNLAVQIIVNVTYVGLGA
ncbi:hypothetical protein PMIN04_001912 [Paraphaeosphaeria minitans]